MTKKSAFPYQPGDRVNVPGNKGVQGLVSFPASKADGNEVGEIVCMRKGGEDCEGRIIFVVWISEDGTRERGYFTETALRASNEIRTIADLLKASRQVLDDVPDLLHYVRDARARA